MAVHVYNGSFITLKKWIIHYIKKMDHSTLKPSVCFDMLSNCLTFDSDMVESDIPALISNKLQNFLIKKLKK